MNATEKPGDIRLSAVTLALPRLEWPFIDQWCRALGRHGVEKLYLGVDKTKRENFVWQKKPNPSYYHLELSEDQIGDRWEDAVARCRCVLDVEQIPVTAPLPNGDRLGRVQRPFFRKVRRRAMKDGFDWVLSCDVDEFPVVENQLTLLEFLRDFTARKPDVSIMRIRQLIFESRWDAFNDCAPRAVHQPCAYNPRVVRLVKYLYRPQHAVPVGPHHARPVTEGYHAARIAAHRVVLHHFRGIEKAFNPGLNKIRSLPSRTARPLEPVPIQRCGQAAKEAAEAPNGKEAGIWVLSYPRTGSYYLCSILNRAGLDPPLDEYFHPNFSVDEEFPLNNKVHPRQFRRRAGRRFGKLIQLRPETRFIVLRRRDLVAATVSCYLARQTGVWQIKAPSQRRRLQRLESVPFDNEKLLKLYHQRSKDDAFWTRVCERHGVRPLTIYYEDLADDPVAIAEKALRFLHLDADPVSCTMQSRNVRQSDYRTEYGQFTARLGELIGNPKTATSPADG